MSEQKLYTVKQFVKLPEFFFLTENSLRHYIFYSEPRLSAFGHQLPTNGLVEAGAIVRIGRKILIDIDGFRRWIDRQADAIIGVNKP